MGELMLRILRWAIILIGIYSLGYSIYKYIESPLNQYYLIGGVSGVLTAIASYIEFKSRKPNGSNVTGDNSMIVNVNGNKNKTKLNNKTGVK